MKTNFDPVTPGFIFMTPPRLSNLGYGEVQINIGATPMERFFDTRKAIFPIVEEGALSQIVVEHPWLSEGTTHTRHVCAGRFRLYETDGDEHQGFSLGGELEISQDENWVSCRLTSNAPIYNLQEDPTYSNQWLVEEIEGILARRMASYGENEVVYLDRLQTVDPFDLFIAALEFVKQEIKVLSPAARDSYQVQYDHVKHIIHILETAGVWPNVPPLINDIL